MNLVAWTNAELRSRDAALKEGHAALLLEDNVLLQGKRETMGHLDSILMFIAAIQA